MKLRSIVQLSAIFLLLVSRVSLSAAITHVSERKNPTAPDYVLLNGEIVQEGNPCRVDGNVHNFNTPLLRLMRTKSEKPLGTVLLIPGGGYEILKMKNEGENGAMFFNNENYDVAILEYHIHSGEQTRDLALTDALQAFRLLRTSLKSIGLRSDRLSIVGISSGGHLAARTVQKLGDKEQPEDLILISPEYLDETTTGTVFPAVMPPINPTARLFTTFSSNDKKAWIYRAEEYTKTWIGYDGWGSFRLLSDSTYLSEMDTNPFDSKLELPGVLKTFLETKPETAKPSVNPAAVPVEGYSPKRHAAKLELVAKEKFDLLMIGNSITNNFEKPEYQPVWNQFFAPRRALNLGYSGYRTENIIWNIQHGELEGQSPKVVVLEIGTNNVDEKHYPTRHTAGQLAGGIEAIVKILREKLPDTKIIVLRCFPGCYGGPNPTSHRAILERASDIVSKLADGKHIFYCDVNHVFLNTDGSINHAMMPDWLHPSPAGAKAWAQAMEPLLSKLMGDKSLDTDIPSN
ncbi:MAG TPA: GDSL-type esterase/lipase family protein [Bacteroidales bacterium]